MSLQVWPHLELYLRQTSTRLTPPSTVPRHRGAAPGPIRTCMLQKSEKAMKHATMEPSAKSPEKPLVAQGLHTCFRRQTSRQASVSRLDPF